MVLLWNSLWQFLNRVSIHFTLLARDPTTPRYFTQEKRSICPQKSKNVHSILIYNSLKLENRLKPH